MSRMRICRFSLGDVELALDVASIREVVPPRPIRSLPRAGAPVCGLIQLRGQIILTVDLCEMMFISSQRRRDRKYNLILKDGAEQVSFLVDKVVQLEQIETDLLQPPLESLPSRIRMFTSGMQLLDDGVLLLVDNAALVQELYA